MNEGFGQRILQEGNSLKMSGPFSELPDSEIKLFCAHPRPRSRLLQKKMLKEFGQNGKFFLGVEESPHRAAFL